jgi:type IV secretion system protein TrbC
MRFENTPSPLFPLETLGFFVRAFIVLALAFFLFCLVTDPSFAAGGQGLPWETPLQKIQKSLTGPVAFFIALIGIVTTGVMLIFGGEISDFTRRMVFVVLVASLLIGAGQFVTMFGGSGASIEAFARL